MKKVVLIGGGHAHLSVLRAMAQRTLRGVELIMVTPSTHQTYSGMLPGWVAGHYTLDDCRIDLRPLIAAAGAQMILGQMVGLDAARRSVTLSDGRHITYDWLSLNIGSETDTSWLETLGNKLLPVKPIGHFTAVWPEILAQAKLKQNYRLVVVGGGAAGVEMALAARYAFTRAAIDAQVDLVASESGFLAGHATKVQDCVRRFIARAALVLHSSRGVGTPQGVLLANGHFLPADHVLAATGARSPVWLGLSGVALDQDGYVLVDRHQRSISHPNLFAGGDICARQDTVMPRSGVHAVHAGPVLGANLLAALGGRSMQTYRPSHRSLYLLSCGSRFAIASWGRWSVEGKWVWHCKDWIDRRFVKRFSETLNSEILRKLEKTK